MRFLPFANRLFHFLGSAQLAILLLLIAALSTAWATYLEAKTESHLYASHLIYAHPLFTLLFGGFFVNILVAALRRWPFQKRHLPFILTHIGLLLILSGVIAKNLWGLQGYLHVLEGSANEWVSLPETFSLVLETPDKTPLFLPFQKKQKTLLAIDDVHVTLHALFPDAEPALNAWIHNGQLLLYGLPPIPLGEGNRRLFFPENPSLGWSLRAEKAIEWEQVAKKRYLDGLKLIIEDEGGKESLLAEDYLSWEGEAPFFSFHRKGREVRLPLTGADALFPIPYNYPGSIVLERSPFLLFLVDEKESVHLLASDPFGRVAWRHFSTNRPSPLVVYDQGFGGYATFCRLPFFYHPTSPSERLRTRVLFLEQQLAHAKEQRTPLAFPLTLWEEPERHLPPFLLDGNKTDLSPLACAAVVTWRGSSSDLSFEKKREELVDSLKAWHIDRSLLFPPINEEQENAWILDFGLREKTDERLTLESPLFPNYSPKKPDTTWEKRTPLLSVTFVKGDRQEHLLLRYDRHGNELHWPLFGGSYRVSFGPQRVRIPYRFRLHQAREICFPQTNQPYSYECDAIVSSVQTGEKKEVTLSMNRVYATPDGYRFYLASMATSPESGIHSVQIAVNYDPFKRWLTYPGIAFVAFGAGWLLLRSFGRRRSDA